MLIFKGQKVEASKGKERLGREERYPEYIPKTPMEDKVLEGQRANEGERLQRAAWSLEGECCIWKSRGHAMLREQFEGVVRPVVSV